MGVFMHYIGKSKIGPLYSKGRIIYPQIRLPQRYKDIIGETANIFEIEHDDNKAFLIIGGKDEKSKSVALEIEDKVLKPDLKVLKPLPENDIESRLSDLESKIEALNRLILKNYVDNPIERRKNSGLGAIRTPDLRRVKATS